MKEKSVKRVYANWSKIYDSLKHKWNRWISSKAEDELSVFLKKNINKNKTILELGCGTALNLEKVFSLNLKFKRYLGLDFSSNMLSIAKKKFSHIKNTEFQEKNINELDAKEKFDIIICTWVLSHLDSPSVVVNKAQKLLKKNGKMFLILFTMPRWYIDLWICPIARLLNSKPIAAEKIKKFKNVKSVNSYLANTVTTVTISSS